MKIPCDTSGHTETLRSPFSLLEAIDLPLITNPQRPASNIRIDRVEEVRTPLVERTFALLQKPKIRPERL